MFSREALAGLAGLTLAAPVSAQIQSSGMGDVNAWSTNLLEREESAISDRIWASSDIEYLVELMQALDVDSMTRAEQALLSRALRSPSTAPRGEDSGDLQTERLRLLAALDEHRAVAMLGRQTEDLPDGVDPDAIIADRRLADGELELVCKQMEGEATGKFWSELRTVCALEAGNMAEAELSIELAAGEDGADPWVTETAIAIIGELEDRPEARFGSGLEVELSHLAGLEVEADALETARPDLAAAFARDERRPLRQRIVAANRAAAAGWVGPEEHRALYETLINEPDFDPENTVETAFYLLSLEPDPVPEISAIDSLRADGVRDLRAMNEDWIEPIRPDDLSEEALEAEPVDEISLEEQQAAALSDALKEASDAAQYRALARLFYPDLKALVAGEDTSHLALGFARAALAADNEALALHWLDTDAVLDTGETDGPGADLLRGYAMVLSRQRDMREVDAIAERLLEDGVEKADRKAAMQLFAVWAGFDLPLPVDARRALADTDGSAGGRSPGALIAMQAATSNGAHGEALLTLLSLSGGAPQDLSPLELSSVFATLRRIGAEKDARALALEVAALW